MLWLCGHVSFVAIVVVFVVAAFASSNCIGAGLETRSRPKRSGCGFAKTERNKKLFLSRCCFSGNSPSPLAFVSLWRRRRSPKSLLDWSRSVYCALIGARWLQRRPMAICSLFQVRKGAIIEARMDTLNDWVARWSSLSTPIPCCCNNCICTQSHTHRLDRLVPTADATAAVRTW